MSRPRHPDEQPHPRDPSGAPDVDDRDNGARSSYSDPAELLTHQPDAGPPDAAATSQLPAVDDEPAADLWTPEHEHEPASRQTRHPLPAGQWTDGAGTNGVWIPAATATAAAPTTSATTFATTSVPDEPPRRSSAADLEAARPADQDSRRVRTSVDRPVSSLRPISIDEARQLAECFALDYMSCDEDDPQLRQLALAPYLSRRADALLGWPTERAGLGRQRAITARAGECLAEGRWVTVDVSVLVEIYHRDGAAPSGTPDPSGSAPERPELPPDARWSAVPPAHAPGWVCSMTVWHRLGIPIRRHDSGGLVVELFTVSEPES